MKIIVGLGNPGSKYEKTRHNIGFILIDKLLQELTKEKKDFSKFTFKNSYQADISEGKYNNEKIFLVKPQTFMNESGKSIQAIINFYKPNISHDLLVIYDDIDLPVGEVRTSGKSAGGHKGMQSIITNLGTEDIHRIRVGILGKPKDKISNTAKYVLSNLSRKELKEINLTFFGICSVIKEFINS